MYIYTHTYIYSHVGMYVYIYIHIHIYTHVDIYVYIYIHTYIYILTRRYICVCVCVYIYIYIYSCYCCSVAQSCPTLCDPMDCSILGFPVLHHLPELAQTHVHRVCDAIQPSHPLSSPSPPAFNLFQHQVFSNESALCIRWPKCGEWLTVVK